MREIGIVDWFDIDKGYGLIARIDILEDLFVHQSQILCSEFSLKEGSFVTYKIIKKKKRQAGEVKLLTEEEDLELLRKAFLSKRNGVWQIGFKKFVPTIVNQPDDLTIDTIFSRLENSSINLNLIEYIPENLLLKFPHLCNYFSISKRIKVLLELMRISKDESLNNPYFIELEITLLQIAKQHTSDWNLIPDKLMSINSIRTIASNNRLFRYYISKLQNEEEDFNISEILKILKREPDYVSQIPEGLLYSYNELFVLLSPQKQIEIVWLDLDNKWDKLTISAKLLAVYKGAKEKDKIQILINKLKNHQESNLLVRLYLFILSAKYYLKDYREKGIEPFNRAHEMFQDLIVNNIEDSEKQLHFVLPNCSHNVTEFCEGRIWYRSINGKESKNEDNSGNEVAFCPREGGPCVVGDSGARLHCNINMEWQKWTLAELLEECELEPNVQELQKNDVYTLKLSGWINRLIEIRARMKCSVCNNIMLADFKYAKNLAVYNSTVARCKQGHESVYLTHCWACHQVIDSRESVHKVGGFHLCVHCGSGPKDELSTYKQGDICPKCYYLNMEIIDLKVMECINCNHKIKLPVSVNLTGITVENTPYSDNYWS